MTDAADTPLSDEARLLKESISRLGTPEAATGPGERAELERRVAELCAAVQALPAADAKAMSVPLAGLIEALEAAAQRLHSHSAGSTASTRTTAIPRQAAAAYGNATNRRRRGF